MFCGGEFFEGFDSDWKILGGDVVLVDYVVYYG